MQLAITGKTSAGKFAPLVYRGPYEEMIPAAAAVGYDAMELHIHDSAELDRAGLKKLFVANGITLSSIGTGSAYGEDRLFLASEDAGVREKAIKRLEDHIITAKDYNAAVIIGLMKGQIKDCASRESCLANLEKSMRSLLTIAQQHKIVLVLEVLNRYESDFLNTIDETLSYVAQYNSEYLKLHIDTYHMNIEEDKIGDNIRKAKGMIGHCHIADSDRWYAGHGHYDFRETVRALDDIGYDKALSVESFMFPDSDTSARKSFALLKEVTQ